MFLDPVIKAEKIKLAPTAYSTHSNWGKDLGNGYKQGHVKKGVFQPRERPLLTKEYMDEAKKKGIPAPGAYKLPQNKKFPLGHSSKSEKNSMHTDAAKWQAMQTPTVCYKERAQLTDMIKPRVFAAKIVETKEGPEVGKKIKKDPAPDMGSYDVKKGQEHCETKGFSQKWDTGPVVKFYEKMIQLKKKVPGSNHYTVTNQAFSRLSLSPPSIRTRR